MPSWTAPAVVTVAFALGLLWWDDARRSADVMDIRNSASDAVRNAEPVQPLPRAIEIDPRKVALGARLFHDPRLSADETVACASCHDLEAGGADGRKRPVGIAGRMGTVNTPTVLNSGFAFRQFWDGRAASLEEQIDGPLKSPLEMGSTWELVLERISADPEYRSAFEALYPAGIDEASVKDAIASFERSLITPDSRLDRHLRGETQALSPVEQRGYGLFKQYGCIGCHQGMLLGGNMFQRLGIVRDYFADRGSIEIADLGRYNVTGDETDRHVFKVPSLRNVALTAPYFHDGSAETLQEAIRVMARYQLGREIPEPEVSSIAAFLETLTGELRSPL
jgi:cytochrome c peroxidase